MANYKVTVVRRETYVLDISAYGKDDAGNIALESVERGNITAKTQELTVLDVTSKDETLVEQLSHQRPGRA
jgi:hypothetical protein